MRLAIKIFFCSTILSACANNTSDNAGVNSAIDAEAKIQNHIDSLEKLTRTSIATEVEEDIQDLETISTLEKAVEIKSTSDDIDSKLRTRSTIAQQQEAARKIQNELENRNPKPNEVEVQEGAVFQKVVSQPSEKKKPTPSSTKKEEPVKKETVKKTAKKKTYAAIEFEEMKMTFDTINQGDIIDHQFIFTNTGNAPLEIKAASATCGCTQPSFPFIPIEPNEQGHISVRYNSVGKEGFQNPEITIKTNIDKKEITLLMEGFVVVKEEEEGK